MLNNHHSPFAKFRWAATGFLSVLVGIMLMTLIAIPEAAHAQDFEVEGVVLSAEDEEPLPGVNVTVEGTTIGTVTDGQGQYSLNVPDSEGVLTFSIIGFEAQSVAIEGQSTIDVSLSPDVSELGELVVIGYGAEHRGRITGSVSSVDSESIGRAVGIVSPEQAIQGRVSGVNVSSASGAPGAGLRIDVRGATSITGDNEPLYVIDGVPISGEPAQSWGYGQARLSPLTHISQSDIESIEILKDAAATAIYGSRASNGVVLITTKSGSDGPTLVDFSSNVGFENVPNRIEMAGSDTWFDVMEQARTNYNQDRGLSPGDPGYQAAIEDPRGPNHTDTDWFQEVTRDRAVVSNVNLSLQGGDERTQFYTSGSYTGHQGIILTNQFERIAGRLNIEHQATDRVSLSARANLSRTVNNRVQNEGDGRGVFTRSLEQRPFDSPFKEDGSYNIGGVDIPLHNGVQVLREQNNADVGYRAFFDARASVNIIEGLNYQGNVGGDYGLSHGYIYRNENHPVGGAGGTAFDWRDINRNLLVENTLTSDHTFGDVHLSGLLGHSVQWFESEPSEVIGQGFPSPSFGYITSAANIISGSTSWTSYVLESYFSRANLNYRDRYTLSATVRRDGSSRFVEENRYGIFPSISAGWRISEEGFMDGVDFLSDLRLRGSYGLTGNQDGIGNFVAMPTATGGHNYRHNTGIAITNVGNPDLTWETGRQFNVAMDLGFFDGRVNVTGEYFVQNTDDLLFSRPLHATTGFTSTTENIGSISNRGVELQIGTVNVQNSNVHWSSDFNISFTRNRVTSLADEGPIPIGHHVLQEGEALGTFYLIRQLGIYQTDDEVPQPLYDQGVRAGDVKFEDVSGDGNIGSADRQIVGTANPDFYGGFSNTLTVGNFDLSALITFKYGNMVYNSGALAWDSFGSRYPLFAVRTEHLDDMWAGEGTSNETPRAVIGNHNNQNSSRFLEDGSYLRLQNIELGYVLPGRLTERLNARQMRLTVAAKNLVTLTGYTGMDPEVTTSLDVRQMGIDRYNVPQMRTITFGVSLGF